MSTKIQ